MAFENSKSLNKELAILADVMLDVSLVVGISSNVNVLAWQDFKYDSKCSKRAFGVWKHDVVKGSWRDEIAEIKFCKLVFAVSLELPEQTISLRKFHNNLCTESSLGNLSVTDI